MGGQALRHIRHQQHRPVAQLGLVVGGHEEVVPWPGVALMQPLQGAAHLCQWHRVRAIRKPRNRPRELPTYRPAGHIARPLITRCRWHLSYPLNFPLRQEKWGKTGRNGGKWGKMGENGENGG